MFKSVTNKKGRCSGTFPLPFVWAPMPLMASAVLAAVVGLGQQHAAFTQELVGVFAKETGNLREGVDKSGSVSPLQQSQRFAKVLVVTADRRQILR